MTGQMPMRHGPARTHVRDLFHQEPVVQGVRAKLAHVVEVPNVPNSVEIWQTFRDSWSKSVIFGQADPNEALTDASTTINKLVGQNEHRRATRCTQHRPRSGSAPRSSAGIRSACCSSAPYALFVAALFAYPLGLAVYMSFHRYFFTAPGVSVPRPFVGLDNYRAVLADPAVRQSFVNIG